MDRRSLLVALGASVAAPAAAQADYPVRPVRIIVPFTAGGSSDLLARLVAKGLGERWRQNVLVENMPGASAIVGTSAAARAAPDGYTILFGTISNLGVNPSLFEGRLPYDPLSSFAPITLAASIPLLLVVNDGLPARSLPDLVALARSRQDLNYGSGGNGSSQHLAMELLKQSAGIGLTHVPYRSSAPALVDLISGQIQVMFDNLNTALPHVRSGKLRALAITAPARAAQLPDVPTMAEAGFPAATIGTWFAFLAPAGTPPEILARMTADARGVLAEPAVRGQLAEQGMEVIASAPEGLVSHLRDEIAKWRQVVRTAGIKVD